MDYSGIKALILSYADSEGVEVANNLDNFLRVTESRISRALQVQKMSVRTTVTAVADQNYYGLPDDFAGLRDIEVYNPDTPTSRTTLKYISPEQMNNYSGNADTRIFYTIIADQLQIMPAQENAVIEIVYYQRLVELDATNTTNWVSNFHPDLYIHGGLVEISAFNKDAAAAEIWDKRFRDTVAEVIADDQQSRWSGTPLEIHLG